MTAEAAAWWRRRFAGPHGLWPLYMAERLTGSAPGEATFTYRYVDPVREEFDLVATGHAGPQGLVPSLPHHAMGHDLARLSMPVPNPERRESIDPEFVPLGAALLIGASWDGELSLAPGTAMSTFEEWLET